MLRAEFDHTLREAQVGNDAAFVRLWRDANPMLTRYLRVAGVADPREAAWHAWAGVIRDLSSFSGDELAWRAWVLGLARDRVDEGATRRGRGSGTHRFSRVGGHGGGDDGTAVGQVEPAELRGVNDTIAAIRDLPLGQGEILMLRLVGELPVARVADLVGTDVVAVRRSEDRAVERLGAERELLAWSLAAPALPEEMADERIALTAFRERTASSPVAGSDRVLAVLPGPHTGRATTANPTIANPTIANPTIANPRNGVPQAGLLRTGKPPTVVRSRMAMLCIAAISASAMSAGALSAAAYVGVLPRGLQQMMHTVIGAPAATEPTGPGDSPSGQPSPGGTASATTPTMGARPTLPQASSRRSGAGTPPPRDTATHRTSSAKTSSAKSPSGKSPSGKTPSGKSSAVRPAPSKPARSNPSATKPKSTSSLSRTSPSAKPTAGVTAPAKGQATSASPAKPAATQRVSPATAHAVGQATVTGATGTARP